MKTSNVGLISIRRSERISSCACEEVAEEEPDEIEINLVSLLKGDTSKIHFFDNFFELPEGRSLSKAQSLEQVYQFVLQCFCQNDTLELSLKALTIINRLADIVDDMSFFTSDQYFVRSISLFSCQIKVVAYNSLLTLNKLISLNEPFIMRCLSLNYLNEMVKVAAFPNLSDVDDSIFYKSLSAVSSSVLMLSRLNIKEINPVLWDICCQLFMNNFSTIINICLSAMKNLIDRGFFFNVDEVFFRRILYFQSAPSEILNKVFSLLSDVHFPNSDQFVSNLANEGFFVHLFKRIEADSKLTRMIFHFLDCAGYVPNENDPLIPITMEIVSCGSLKNRIEAMSFLFNISRELPQTFCLYLANNDIFRIMSYFIDAKVEILSDILSLIERIIVSVESAGGDMWEVPSSNEVVEALQSILGDYEAYDLIISRILSRFKDC